MKNFFLYLIVFFIPLNFFSQFLFDRVSDIDVVKAGENLLFPWDGGLNFVQASEIDYDFDGDMDLFFFDRSSDNIRLYENYLVNNVRYYKQVPNAKSLFPDELSHRVELVDFNFDGKNDIFTYGLGGVKVYKNVGSSQIGLQWQLHYSLLYSDYGNNLSNLYVSSTDLPAYVDLDFDGDIDILTFDLNGEAIEYHKNMGKEWYNNSDSLVFILKNKCWGKFKEDQVSFNIILNDNTSPCSNGNIIDPEFPTKKPYIEIYEQKNKKNRHTGSTILAIDIDNSGVYDLLLGDVSGNNVCLLINDGLAPNTNSLMNNYIPNFPDNSVPISFPVFPSMFYIDLNFDNKKDLLISGNAKNAAKNFESTVWYKNINDDDNPIFIKQNKNFISSEMIDNGTGSIPILFDQNGDGLKDLIVSSLYRYKDNLEKESALILFRNIGSSNSPKYQFVENDYLSLSQLNLGFRIVPTFGDLDNNGVEDMIFGKEDGTVLFWKNNAMLNQNAQFDGQAQVLLDSDQNIIDVGTYSYPQLFDLNNDSLLDLIIGNKAGQIFYYKNIGTADSYSFKLVNDLLGNIDYSSQGIEYLSPHFVRFEDTTYLFLGSQNGKIAFYKDIEQNLNIGNSFTLVNDKFRQIDVEAYSSCLIYDLDNDGKLNMLLGGDLGGLNLFEHNPDSHLGIINKNEDVSDILYPNPFKNYIILKNYKNEKYKIFSIQGQIIQEGISNKDIIKTELLEKGTYFVVVHNRTYKLIKE